MQALETRILITSEISLPEIWLYREEIISSDFGITSRLTAIY